MATSKIKLNGLKSPTSVNLSNEWTAPCDGLMNLYVGWEQGNYYSYLYVSDLTTNEIVGALSENGANGNSVTTLFPIVGGHRYKITYISHVGESRATFYPI